MSRRRVSLTDVARAAGVGLATASRALTGNAEVGAATRARILETAAELGYRPSGAAQALRAGRTRTIELMLHTDFQAIVIRAAFESCAESGYHLLITRPATGQGTPLPAVDARLHVSNGPVQTPPDEVPSERLDISRHTTEALGPLTSELALSIIARLEAPGY